MIIHGLPASLTAAVVSTLGIIAVASFGDWTRKNSAYFSAFAVGLLTVGVLFHLLLEAVAISMAALSWVAVGFTAMVLIGISVQAAVDRRADGAALTFGYASIITLAAHSSLDGVIYAAVFQKETISGWLATGGLLLHEFPEGVIAYTLLATAGIRRLQAVIIAFAAAAITTVMGTFFANFALQMAGKLPMAAMLGAASGALIYVLIVHLGPHAASTPNKRGYLVAQFGVIVATAAVVMQSLSGGH